MLANVLWIDPCCPFVPFFVVSRVTASSTMKMILPKPLKKYLRDGVLDDDKFSTSTTELEDGTPVGSIGHAGTTPMSPRRLVLIYAIRARHGIFSAP